MMNPMTLFQYAAIASLTSVLALPGAARAVPVVFSIGGNNTPASIQTTVDSFRSAAGNPLNPNVAGSFPAGRREINWDGVPDNFSAPNNLPNNFFNVNSPRGAVFSTPGTAVQVSANAANPTNTAIEFGNINANYPQNFATFSAQRLFTAIGSNIADVTFFVPGSSTPAVVSAFGSVFTDVDLANTTKIDYFDPNGVLLTSIFVPVGTTSNESLSFAGVAFNAGEQIGRVRITSGNSALGPNDGAGIDIVVMDDFIFSEPRRVPEPASAQLALLGFVVLAAGIARRRYKQ